jgi:hypothetical protein
MKLTTKQLKQMIKEEIARVYEAFGHSEVVAPRLSKMTCKQLKTHKQNLSYPKEAPIWAAIEKAIEENCGKGAATEEAKKESK